MRNLILKKDDKPNTFKAHFVPYGKQNDVRPKGRTVSKPKAKTEPHARSNHAYSTEIFREEKQGLGLSTLSAAWGIGLVIGPALGGYLAQPAVKYPHLFPKDSFWDKFPYFLPSLSVSAFAFVVAIACIWLPETLHNHPLSNESIDDAEALETGNISNDDDKIIQKDENLFLNWPLMSSIIVYSIFSLYNVAYQEVFSLWAVSPGRFGGLNFTTDNVGDVLAISGIGLIVSQLFLYPSLERAFGPIKFARISAVSFFPFVETNATQHYIGSCSKNVLLPYVGSINTSVAKLPLHSNAFWHSAIPSY
ncbi:hypothetical protein KIW84_058373 [Lathyrus oleraceus]|uniref:Major facilitator superfamily (MFS) profile domain-containing protein n=1 Tax=Pisum sativum TaxID=3888 RepID=A0A9D4X5Y1_PEA|nr:hypothetical protein KIW84_058373 [Pisum sativum]